MTSIAAVIPSLGRPTLDAAVASCADADEVVVLLDDENDPHGCYGHPLRNAALDNDVSCDWVVSLDDDDVLLPGALDAIRAALETGGSWFLFRMRMGAGSHCPGVVVWNEKRVRVGNVGTPMIVAPASAKARWGAGPNRDSAGLPMPDGYLGDHAYALALRAELGEPVWCPTVIAEVRPQAIESAA